MNKTLKRVLALVTAILMVVSVFAACGTQSTKNTNTPTASAPASATPAAKYDNTDGVAPWNQGGFSDTSDLPTWEGKKLDLICQEMNRETNTIASKSQDYDIIQATIDIKGEIEKIREHLRNLE